MTRRALLLGAAAAPVTRPPNVVLIFTDDQGYGDLGCYGARDLRTPHIDKLASEGIRFTGFYAAPICSPSRAALLTGCYPARVGIPGVLPPNAKSGIDPGEKILPELLREHGYATAIFGKWHLGEKPEFSPLRHGFDEWLGTPGSNDMGSNMDMKARAQGKAGVAFFENDRQIETDPDQSQLTRRYSERAISFIERHRARPFFLYLSHNMPHTPIFASPRFRGKSRRGLYGDAIEEIDSSTGDILSALRRNGLDRDTLVIFTSDNGPWRIFGDHGGSPGPFRGGKREATEGGFRVPAIFRWPGRIPPRRVTAELATNMDILPTLAGLAGATLPTHTIDGRDLWPILYGQPNARSPHEAFFYYYEQELRAVRSGNWKLVLPHTDRAVPDPTRPGNGGARGEVRSVVYTQALYDLAKDPGEINDVSATHPDAVARLTAFAERARADLGDAVTGRTGSGVRVPYRGK